MRGRDRRTEGLFSYVSCESRVPAGHPLRSVLPLVDGVLSGLSPAFQRLYAVNGRPSIPPEKLLRALLLQAFYSVRSERQLMQQLDYNLLFRWFVGLGVDDPVWDVTVFTKNRDRLLEGAIAAKVVFIPDPVAWTEVPTSVAVFGRQRERWHRGLIATMVAHRQVLFNPKYGATGLIAMPYFLFAELLAPVVEATGLVITVLCTLAGILSIRFAVAFFIAAYLFGTLLSLAAILMEEVSFHRYRRPADTARLLWFAFIEPFGFRQITVWYRLKAFYKFLKGDHSWGRMRREGFGTPAPADAPARISPAA